MGLLHSCFPLGHTHTPHPLQMMLIFRQLYCTALPHNCLCPSGRMEGRITQLWRAEESNLDRDELLGIMMLPLQQAASTQEM